MQAENLEGRGVKRAAYILLVGSRGEALLGPGVGPEGNRLVTGAT